MNATATGLHVGHHHNLADSASATHHQDTLHPPHTTSLKADKTQINKHGTPIVNRLTTFAHQTDRFLGHSLANTVATRAMPPTGLVMDYADWLQYLHSAKNPISPATLAMIENARERVTPFEQLVFIVEASLGFGDLNLYIECVRCFERFSTGTIKQIVFTGDNEKKLAPLISGFSQVSNTPVELATDCPSALVKSAGSSKEPTTSGKLFGIDYIFTDEMTSARTNALYIYTTNACEDKLPLRCQSIQIVNYRWFRQYNYREEGVVLNEENHLPVYPCEILAGINSTALLHAEIARSFAELGSNSKCSLYSSPAAVASLLGDIFSQAAAGKIHMAFCYHSLGMSYQQYRLYIQAALRCFGEKPIIFIAPKIPDHPNNLSADGHKRLADEVSVEFIDVRILTNRSAVDLTDNKQVTVIHTGKLPKRVVELAGLFSTLPGFGPGASTANLFECLGVPYLGQDGHDLTIAGDASTAQRWQFINSIFDFDIFKLHVVLELFKETVSDTRTKRYILESWFDPSRNQNTTKQSQDLGRVASTFLHHFFQGTHAAMEFITLSPAQSKDYIDRLLNNESLIEQYIDYIHNESISIIANYILSATAVNGEFRNHAINLQERALSPQNNTLLEVINRRLSPKPILTTTPSLLEQIISWVGGWVKTPE